MPRHGHGAAVKIDPVHDLNADLHSHSTASDGTLVSAALAARAKANGVELWALTDHDETGGIAEARAAAKALDLPYVAGVEISVTWGGITVHIVGLRIDPSNTELQAGLASVRNGRMRRAERDRKSTRLNSSHALTSRMPSSA